MKQNKTRQAQDKTRPSMPIHHSARREGGKVCGGVKTVIIFQYGLGLGPCLLSWWVGSWSWCLPLSWCWCLSFLVFASCLGRETGGGGREGGGHKKTTK